MSKTEEKELRDLLNTVIEAIPILVVGCLALLIKQGKLMRVKMEKPVDEDKN